MTQLLGVIAPRNMMGGNADGQMDKDGVFIERDVYCTWKASFNTHIGKGIRKNKKKCRKSEAIYIYAYINSLRPSDAYMRQ